MVKTPWSSHEMPFEKAAAMGTEKVITDHATIGVIVTCDGTFGELDREAFVEAEMRTVEKLRAIGKPYVMIVNSGHPHSEETKQLAKQLELEYQCSVLPMNCQQMKKKILKRFLSSVLYEFPVSGISFTIPKWVEMLPAENEMKQSIAGYAKRILEDTTKVRDIFAIDFSQPEDYIENSIKPGGFWRQR